MMRGILGVKRSTRSVKQAVEYHAYRPGQGAKAFPASSKFPLRRRVGLLRRRVRGLLLWFAVMARAFYLNVAAILEADEN